MTASKEPEASPRLSISLGDATRKSIYQQYNELVLVCLGLENGGSKAIYHWFMARQSQSAAVELWKSAHFLNAKKLQFSGNFEEPGFLSIFVCKKLPCVRLWRSPL